ncbi:hypothetical protein IHE44_0002416, partial [Lamprotornis superbus]
RNQSREEIRTGLRQEKGKRGEACKHRGNCLAQWQRGEVSARLQLSSDPALQGEMEAPGRSHQAPSMVTTRLLGSLELWLANTFLPLLLFTWLSVGAVSLQTKPVNTVLSKICLENLTVQVKWYKPECLEGEIQTNTVVLVENSTNFSISRLCTACTEISVCRVSITRPNSTDTGNSPQRAVLGENCMNFNISNMCTNCTEICVYRVSITRSNSIDTGNSPQRAVLGENCMNFSISSLCTACTEISVCRVSITTPNLTDTGNSTQAAVLNFLCILLGLAVGTLLHMPVIGFLLWQRRRNTTGELLSEEVAEENQASTAAPVTETEDLTYANLNFEKKGTGPASSNVIYTEIKSLQQKQSDGDGSAANTDVDVYPKEEGNLILMRNAMLPWKQDSLTGFCNHWFLQEDTAPWLKYPSYFCQELHTVLCSTAWDHAREDYIKTGLLGFNWRGAVPDDGHALAWSDSVLPHLSSKNLAGGGTGQETERKGYDLARSVSPNCINSNTTSLRCGEEAED